MQISAYIFGGMANIPDIFWSMADILYIFFLWGGEGGVGGDKH